MRSLDRRRELALSCLKKVEEFLLVVDAEFCINMLYMAAHGVFRDDERLGNVGLAAPAHEQAQDFALAARETVLLSEFLAALANKVDMRGRSLYG